MTQEPQVTHLSLTWKKATDTNRTGGSMMAHQHSVPPIPTLHRERAQVSQCGQNN